MKKTIIFLLALLPKSVPPAEGPLREQQSSRECQGQDSEHQQAVCEADRERQGSEERREAVIQCLQRGNQAYALPEDAPKALRCGREEGRRRRRLCRQRQQGVLQG